MPCGRKCSKVKTKFMSKFRRPCSYKQEETEAQKKQENQECPKNDGTETKDQAGDVLENGIKISETEDLLVEKCRPQTLTPQEERFLQVCEEHDDDNDEIDEQIIDEQIGERDQTSVPTSGPRRKMSTHFVKLRGLLKAKNRRDAICDEMEKKIEPAEGVSLRQYRKFLATSSVLQELKML